MTLAYLGLGSNEGDRLENLRTATMRLDQQPDVEVVARSSAYETEPVGEVLDQRDFLNAVLAIETELEPIALLDLCKTIERDLGREPGGVRHGPRPIDIDVLLVGSQQLRHERLTLPHPEVTSRRFVLVPLLELEPGLALPDGTGLAAALAAFGERQRVRRVDAL